MRGTAVLWWRASAYWLVVLGREWRAFVAFSILTPVLYLAGLGFGVGTLVDRVAGWDGVSYAAFVAPGLLAASTMQTAVSASTWQVMWAVLWSRAYHTQLATPLRVSDVLAGHAVVVGARLAVSATAFTAVLAALGLAASPWAAAAAPAAVLTGLAFAGPLMAFTATLSTTQPITVVLRFVIIPLFLLGGVFAPVDQFPQPLPAVVVLTPLWHGVELCRAATLGPVEGPGPSALAALGHVAVLVGYAVVGWAVALRTYRRSLS